MDVLTIDQHSYTLWNLFVQNAKYICQNAKLFVKMLNVFVQIASDSREVIISTQMDLLTNQ